MPMMPPSRAPGPGVVRGAQAYHAGSDRTFDRLSAAGPRVRRMGERPDPTHEFDFWVGRWDVFGPAGRQLGTNVIVPLFDGLVLHENWSGVGGMLGTSLNSYDAARGCWHQTW